MLRRRPRPGASCWIAASPPARNRLRHRSTVGRVVPHRRAIWPGGTPWVAKSTIRARRCTRRGVVRAWTHCSMRVRSESLIVNAAARLAMAVSLLSSGTLPGWARM